MGIGLRSERVFGIMEAGGPEMGSGPPDPAIAENKQLAASKGTVLTCSCSVYPTSGGVYCKH